MVKSVKRMDYISLKFKFTYKCNSLIFKQNEILLIHNIIITIEFDLKKTNKQTNDTVDDVVTTVLFNLLDTAMDA